MMKRLIFMKSFNDQAPEPDPTYTNVEYEFINPPLFYDFAIYNGVYYLGTSEGLIRKNELGSWELVPNSPNTYIPQIAHFNNFIVCGTLNSKLLISTDSGINWNILDLKGYNNSHVSSVNITNIGGTNYLFVGSQNGKIIKYNLDLNTFVQIWSISSGYIRSIIYHKNTLVYCGYDSLGYINGSGQIVPTSVTTLVAPYTDVKDLTIGKNNELYASANKKILKSTDSKNWSVVTANPAIDSLSKGAIFYNSEEDEYLVGYSNDIKFIITNDFNTYQNIQTYKRNSSQSAIIKILWNSTERKYIIVSQSVTAQIINHFI